ncbi:alpha-mannosidase [Anaeramoeba flamelloides]|uniref:Alpha-mannosidase n=1 Tax=Anaeramoeba flamelloides TaxID=1746091 RepID=A0ABQ8Z4B6_9EUKA|nr:alpha-mannosidase [Anaeramoeba flamelloides]
MNNIFFSPDLVSADPDPYVVVHMLPHSHCDVGWQETPEEYYTTRVKYILDTVVEECVANPEYRFIWVEVWFLQQWWADSTELQREQFRGLVRSRQIELVLGGIVMSDDASVYYADDIDQLTEGHTWLKENVVHDQTELLPKSAWHIDPFGESSWNPTFYYDMCFDVFGLNRISKNLKELYMDNQEMEFIWRGLSSKSSKSGRERKPSVLGHILPHHYSSPPGFDWEYSLSHNPPITPENIDTRANVLYEYLQGVATSFQDNVLLQTMGNDFHFQHASWQYGNMSLLIQYINTHQEKYNMTIQFSTLREYFSDLYSRELEFPVSSENFDFFPYNSALGDDYWTGYFTSWPFLKRLIRYSSNILRTADFFWSLSGLQLDNEQNSQDFENILWLRREMGVAQHHDTITGTSPQVNIQRAHEQLLHGQSLVKDSLNHIITNMQQATNIDYGFNIDTLVSEIANKKQGAVVVLNNLAWEREEWIKISFENYTALSFDLGDITVKLYNGDELDTSKYTYINKELFIYVEIPQLGYQTYLIELNSNGNDNDNNHENMNESEKQNVEVKEEELKEFNIKIGDLDEIKKLNLPNVQGNILTLENQYYKLTFDLATGKSSTLTSLELDLEIAFEQDWYTYIGDLHDNAYVFQTCCNATMLADKVKTFKYYTSESHLVQEVRIMVDDFVSQTIRLYENVPEIEVEMIVGPILPPMELISRYNVGLETDGYIYTDSYGAQLFEKYKWPRKEYVSSQYRPLTSYAILRDYDQNLQMNFIHDFARGAGAYGPGSIEFMHLRADIEETRHWLFDTTITNQKIWITLDTLDKQEAKRARNNIIHQRAPLVMFSKSAGSTMQNPSFTGLQDSFPDLVHLLTLKKISKDNPKSHIRFMNVISPETENEVVNVPSDINLSKYLQGNVWTQELSEVTLSGIQSKSQCILRDWKWSDTPQPHPDTENRLKISESDVNPIDHDYELLPGEIRTFEIQTVKK